MEAVSELPTIELYHTLDEPSILKAAEAASALELAFESVIPAGDGGECHFQAFGFKKIRTFTDPINHKGVIGAALMMLEDLNLYQVPVALASDKSDAHTVFVRRVPSTGPLSDATICTPMMGSDVRAICAMVSHGDVRAVNKLTRFGLAEIRRWRKSGVKAKREDVRRVFLGLLDDYVRAGSSLDGVALRRTESVEERSEIAKVRRAWISENWFDLLEKVKAIQTLRNPVVEQKIDLPPVGITQTEHDQAPVREITVADVVEEGLKLHALGRLCEKCKLEDAGERRLCAKCEDALISSSGVVQLTKGDIPEFDGAGLVGSVMPVVGRAAFDAGITEKEDYDYVAEQVTNLVATFDQYDIEMEEAGMWIKGVNVEDVPTKATHRDARSADGVVVAAGMEFRPHMLRHLINQISQTVREVQGMYSEPLLERARDGDDVGVSMDRDARRNLKMLKSRLGLLSSIAEELGAEIVEGDVENRATGF